MKIKKNAIVFMIVMVVGIVTIIGETAYSSVSSRNKSNSRIVNYSQKANNEIPASFIMKSFRTTENIDLKYWLYTPKNPSANMPLIIYLHGGSGIGDDLNLVIQDGFPKYLKDGELGDVPAYVIIPQVPSNYKGWSDIKVSIRDLITNIQNAYDINPNKISLTGHSMGGTGTYNIALAYPNLFSCIAPMSGSILNNEVNINKLANVPIWAFVGAKDTIVDPSKSIDFINSLKSINSSDKVTIFDDADHFTVPELGYKTTNVIEWLVSNEK